MTHRKLFWKKADIIEAFGISESFYRKLVECGQLTHEPIPGKHRIYHRDAIERIFRPDTPPPKTEN